MPAWTAIAGFLSLVVTIAGAAIKIMRTIDRAESRLESRLVSIELRLAVVKFQNRALLKAFPRVVSGLINASMVVSEQGAQLISAALEMLLSQKF